VQSVRVDVRTESVIMRQPLPTGVLYACLAVTVLTAGCGSEPKGPISPSQLSKVDATRSTMSGVNDEPITVEWRCIVQAAATNTFTGIFGHGVAEPECPALGRSSALAFAALSAPGVPSNLTSFVNGAPPQNLWVGNQ
jgi:hypothetical protein